MGFDFQMVDMPEKLPPAHVQKFKNYVAVYKAHVGDFRLNASNMPALLAVMVTSGVATTETKPSFPAWPPSGFDEETAQRVGGAMLRKEKPQGATDAQVKSMTEYLAKRDVVIRTRSAKKTNVPRFKFDSNEGWVVLPEECTLIAKALRTQLAALNSGKADPKLAAAWETERMKLPAPFRPVKYESEGPVSEDFRKQLLMFIEFNELAALHGGYTVN